jgi:hypothetical protein
MKMIKKLRLTKCQRSQVLNLNTLKKKQKPGLPFFKYWDVKDGPSFTSEKKPKIK